MVAAAVICDVPKCVSFWKSRHGARSEWANAQARDSGTLQRVAGSASAVAFSLLLGCSLFLVLFGRFCNISVSLFLSLLRLLTFYRWKQTCDAWAPSCPAPVIHWYAQNVTQRDADRVWDGISKHDEDMLHAAVLFCAPEVLVHSRKGKNHAKFVCSYQHFGKLDISTASFRLHKLRNLEAKLREVVRLQQQQTQRKVLHHPLFPRGTWRQRF